MGCIVLVAAFLCAISGVAATPTEVTQVVDLGAGVGRRGKASTIRRGASVPLGGLATNGAFQMSFQGNFEEELGASSSTSTASTTVDTTAAVSAAVTATQQLAKSTYASSAPSGTSLATPNQTAGLADSRAWAAGKAAWNTTHGSEDPASDGKALGLETYDDKGVLTGDTLTGDACKKDDKKSGRSEFYVKNDCKKIQNMCLTQTAVIGDPHTPAHYKGKTQMSCTSCKDGNKYGPFGFVVKFQYSRAGECVQYPGGKPYLWCTKLDEDSYDAAPQEANKVCTTLVVASTVLRTNYMSDEAKAFIKPLKLAEDGLALVKCAVRKETMCRGVNCVVKKQVSCDRVCKAVVDHHGQWIPKKKSCFGKGDALDLCAGKDKNGNSYGALFCRETAMMA